MNIQNFDISVDINPGNGTEKDQYLDKAYAYLKDMKSFPDYMENVKGIQEETDENDTLCHSWNIIIEDAEFQWKQRTVADEKKRHINFDLIEGDFEHMQGSWKVTEDNERCSLQLTMEYSIGLPIIEDVLGPVLSEKLKANTFTILNTIKDRLEVSNG